jgi:hypothetical protein
MTSADSPRQQLLALVSQLCEGSLSPEAERSLAALVVGNVELRRTYLRYVMLHSCLQEKAVKPQAVALRSPVLTRLAGFAGPLLRPVVLTTLSVAALLYGVFIFLAWNLRPDAIFFFARHGAETIRQPLATITALQDCQWSQERKLGDTLYAEEIGLLSGVAEITFTDGAAVTVQGPADFSLATSDRGYLRRGHLVAEVPRRAIGFTIETPSAEIVDLGTEFGVDVDATGRTDVQVLAGAVNVDYSSLDDKSKSARRSVHMTAGSAKRFSAQSKNTGSIVATEIPLWLDKSASITKHLDQAPNSPAETKYAAVVLADRPLGYWRFSDTDVHRATDASGHGNHGEYVGFVSMKNAGICPNTSDRSVRFLGKQYGGYVQIKDFELPASFTVELWARSSAPSWQNYGWLLSSRMPNGVVITPVPPGQDWQVFMINSSEDGRVAGTSKIANIADRFHHYVFSYDAAADRGTMYIDGALMRETANVFKDVAHREAARLTFYVGRDDRAEDDAWGEGSIDELAIYATVLSPETVKRHYEASEVSDNP